MKKTFTKIWGGILLAVLGFAFYSLGTAGVLAAGNLSIKFESTPLFKEINFLPGSKTTHFVEVENKGTAKAAIGVKVIDHSSCTSGCLSERLKLEINAGSAPLYTGTLAEFFNAGEIKLSDLLAGEKVTYNFSIEFLNSGNDYKDSTVNFDFNIGAFGSETVGDEVTPPNGGGGGGGGGGVSSPIGLVITNEASQGPTDTQVTITWLTNHNATSRVIYSSVDEPHTLNLDAQPNYGYSHSTIEDLTMVTGHSVTVTGLNPGTTYYFRCVSHGSFAVSLEKSFTTSGSGPSENPTLTPQETKTQEGKPEPILIAKNENSVPEQSSGNAISAPEKEGNTEKENPLAAGVAEVAKQGVNNLLAGFSNLFTKGNICWLLFFAVIAMLILAVLEVSKENKTKKDRAGEWLLFGLAVLLAAAYCKFCPYCWVLILVIAICLAFMVWVILREKEKPKQ